MKKIIALLLALIMSFSVATVAFATEGETTTDAPATDNTIGAEIPDDIYGSIKEALGEDFAWVLDLPFESLGPALWFAKMVAKIVIAYISICNKLGLDPAETAAKIFEFIGGLAEDLKPEETPEEAPAPEANPEVAPAA